MAQCQMCGKSPQFGHNVSHSLRRTNRNWLPNIQKTIIMVDGLPRRMKLCANCMRTLAKKQG